MDDLFNSSEELEILMKSETPCDHCGCKELCASKLGACSDFSDFVTTGKVKYENRMPSRQMYIKVMNL